ncbi:unnamed protein product [Somion occarium]|uniref:Alpha-N-acetylglucosaminidase n=1 Tax=Somion occarium TaxID=3059160 RepID=A0ABP1CJE8_9APHY
MQTHPELDALSPIMNILGVVFFAVFACIQSIDALDFRGLHSLVQRRLPQHAKDFTFEALPEKGDKYIVGDTVGKRGAVTISCTSISACSRGLYVYLTDFGGVDIWWTGSRLHELPSNLPPVGKPVTGDAVVEIRYHFNTVTFGYTTAFWTFEKWSLLLDWLALRGVNLPLAWIGYEHILSEVFHDTGLSDTEIASFLAGPNFLPWNRFGNIQGSWGGNLPTQWVEDQFVLGKQIIQRMVELGMTPVLPSFTGFVPRALATHYPNASIVTGGQWSGFESNLTDVSFLEPFDPLFAELQKSFILKQQAAYGNVSHVYTLDQYNENDPFSGDISYLRNVSSNTFSSLRAADPEAVWLMQGWLFFSSSTFWTNDRVEAYLGGVEGNDTMIVLDLYSEAQPQWNRTNSYFGKQWVWCELHDYGGNMGMEGNLEELTNGPITALQAPGSSMKGVGLTMEGQEGNEIVYDILLDQAWSSTPLKVSDYVAQWVSRRYPVQPLPAAAQKSWQILSTTVYNNKDPNSQATIKSILELSPALTGLVNRTGHHPTLIPYTTNTTILPALKLLLQASDVSSTLRNVPEYRYDIVDITRQLLANSFVDLYRHLITVYNNSTSSHEHIMSTGSNLVRLLGDLDRLLYTNENFLLSTWIADARQWAGNGPRANTSYAAYLEYNARNQLTLWGPNGEINDYATKQWAGLVGEYYSQRWKLFVDYLAGIKQSGQPYDATYISRQLLAIGQTWQVQKWRGTKGQSWGTKGDTFDVVEEVLRAWA